MPARVVEPSSVNFWSGRFIVFAKCPEPDTKSTLKSSIAEYRYSSTACGSRWISSMNRTSPCCWLERMPTTSAGLSRAGPEVCRSLQPSSLAMIWEMVVLPRPGGPWNRAWSSVSPRCFAASTAICMLSTTCLCPMYSAKYFGRSSFRFPNSSAFRSAAEMLVLGCGFESSAAELSTTLSLAESAMSGVGARCLVLAIDWVL